MAAGTSDGTAVKVAVIGGIAALLAAAIGGLIPVVLNDDDDGAAPTDPPRTVAPAEPTASSAVTTSTGGDETTTSERQSTTSERRSITSQPSTTRPPVVEPTVDSAVVKPVGWSHDQLESALVVAADLPFGFQETPIVESDVAWANPTCRAAEAAFLDFKAAVPAEALAERYLVRPTDLWEVYQSIMVLENPQGWLDAAAAADAACTGVRFSDADGFGGVYQFVDAGSVPAGADAGRSGLATIHWDVGATQTESVYYVIDGNLGTTISFRSVAPFFTPLLADQAGFVETLVARLPDADPA